MEAVNLEATKVQNIQEEKKIEPPKEPEKTLDPKLYGEIINGASMSGVWPLSMQARLSDATKDGNSLDSDVM